MGLSKKQRQDSLVLDGRLDVGKKTKQVQDLHSDERLLKEQRPLEMLSENPTELQSAEKLKKKAAHHSIFGEWEQAAHYFELLARDNPEYRIFAENAKMNGKEAMYE